MATFRVGVGSFNIQDGAVGFGTDTDGLGNLKVKGVTKTTDIKVSGASTLTRYSGFAADNIDQLENITLTSEVGTIGDIVVGVGTSVIISSGSTVTVGTVESVSIGTHFSPPKGGIEDRGQDFVEGMMRFNTDLNTIEFYNGDEWRQFNYQLDIKSSPSSRGRGVFSGGQSPDTEQVIDFVNITTGGNALDFGLLVSGARHSTGSASNEIRGLIGGDGPGGSTVIEYITIGSKGNSIDFGDLTSSRRNPSGMSSSTRGIFACGSSSNVMDYVEFMTLGNALDFGDALFAQGYQAACQSPTRGVIGAGSQTPGSKITFINIASKGNSAFFGEPNIFRRSYGGASNSVRGIFGGGTTPAPYYKSTEYITIASAGNGQDFGELIEGVHSVNATASQTKAFFVGGATSVKSDRIESVTIASAGNAVDFGNLTKGRQHATALSDCHGGLGGY